MDTQALDKKLRRKSRRQARQLKVHCPDLLKAQQLADRKIGKVNTLNNIIDNGSLSDKLAANKAKREMNTVWIKSGRDRYCDARVTPKEVKHEVIKSLEKAVRG